MHHVSLPELAMRTGTWVDVRPGNVRNAIAPNAIETLVRAPVGMDPNQVTTNLPGVSPPIPSSVNGYFGDADLGDLGVSVQVTGATVAATASAIAGAALVGALLGGKKKRLRGAGIGTASLAGAAVATFGFIWARDKLR